MFHANYFKGSTPDSSLGWRALTWARTHLHTQSLVWESSMPPPLSHMNESRSIVVNQSGKGQTLPACCFSCTCGLLCLHISQSIQNSLNRSFSPSDPICAAHICWVWGLILQCSHSLQDTLLQKSDPSYPSR